MSRRTPLVLIALLLSACSQEPAETVRLRMEIAHPMLADAARSPRLWAICMFDGEGFDRFSPGDKVAASLSCGPDSVCVVSGIKRAAIPPSDEHVLWIAGRVLQKSQERRQLMLLLEPFPVAASRSQKQWTRFEQGVTKLVDAEYQVVDGRLNLVQIYAADVENRPPLV